MSWIYPRRVSELPTTRVNGRVAEKLPGETLMISEGVHQPLWGSAAFRVDSDSIVVSPRANEPIILPFGAWRER